jgi:hypothetical protein
MKLLYFLGRGVSSESGLPSARRLTGEILKGSWHRDSNGNYSIETGDATPEKHVLRLQIFLSLLKSRAEKYLESRSSRVIDYAELHHLCSCVAAEREAPLPNPALLPFLNEIETSAEELCASGGPEEQEYGVSELAADAAIFIQCALWHSLQFPHSPANLQILEDLAAQKTLERLDICTLSGDLSVENGLHHFGVRFLDGFAPPDGDVRWFDPTSYSSLVFDLKTRVRLFKLCGSISWWMLKELSGDQTVRLATVESPEKKLHNANGRELARAHPRPKLLLESEALKPTWGNNPASELRQWFCRLLREHHQLIMSGYDWDDAMINASLLEWLGGASTHRLILLHPKPRDMQVPIRLRTRYATFAERSQIVTVPKPMRQVVWSDLAERIR